MSDTFRQNAFGEKIAQPAATLADIENMLFDRYTPDRVEVQSADLFLEGDENYKFGGTLYFTLVTGEDTEEADYSDAQVEFDGFNSIEAVRDWLEQFNIPGSINEVSF